ncbi:phage tail spike protein [Companilactobacillus sp.]|uniref:phage tail spike protein n=1 Tax=Companilactobacillus sp. TaxID=2767905 RepID=UPI002635C7B5|nr:phage tail spike protein [Companilactobacillus sp.]
MQALCRASTVAPKAISIFDDKHLDIITNNVWVSSYDFSINQQHANSKYFTEGNYIAFKDRHNRTRIFTLMSHDGNHQVRTWHAEEVGLGLINVTADKWDYSNEPHTIAWYLDNLVLKNTGWEIGVNEISSLTRSLKFEGQSGTQLTRLGDVANQFDGAEVAFEVEMTGSRITKQTVNIYKKIGHGQVADRYIDNVDLLSLQTSGSIEDLRTSMIGYGSQPDVKDGENTEDVPPIDFADLSYDDGQFFSPKGDKAVYDRVNGQLWRTFRGYNYTGISTTDGYLGGVYTYDTKDPNELLARTISHLKEVNTLSEIYEANLLHIDANIGEYVQIAHHGYNPPIYLQARVEQITYCYSAKGKDTAILGDYTKLESHVDPRVQQMIDDIKNQISGIDSNYVWVRYAEDDQGKNMTATPNSKSEYVAFLANQKTGVPSDNPADYAGHWTKIKGDQGPKGDSGVGTPGKPGSDGRTPYFHTAWANSADGKQDFSTTGGGERKYMGTFSDFTEADSTDPTKYTWQLTKGADGAKGIAGDPGPNGKTPYFHTAWANDVNGTKDFSVSESIGRGYMGTYTDFTEADSTDPKKYNWIELVGALVIGGRNYLLNTKSAWNIQGSGGGNQGSGGKWKFTFGKVQNSPLNENDDFVISFNYIYTGTGARGTILAQFNGTPWGQFPGTSTTPTTDTGRVVYKGKWKDSWEATANLADGIQIRLDNVATTQHVTIYNAQFEYGNKATDYKEAPEDTQALIDSLSTPNLVYNAGLQGSYKNGLDGWHFGSAITDKWYKTSQPSSMIDGVNALAINGSIPASANAIADSKPISVQAGNVVSASIYMKIGTDSGSPLYTAAEIHFTNDSGSQVGSNVQIGSVNNKTDYVILKQENVAIPTGATHIGIRCYAHNSSTSAVTVHAFWCRPVINYGTNVIPYKDNQGSGGDVSQINEDLGRVENLYNSILTPIASITAPTNPKTGQQWWVLDANGKTVGFKIWNGSVWKDATIQQSALNVDVLNGNTLNGATINTSNFNMSFDQTNAIDGVNKKGTTTIKNGEIKTDFQIKNTTQTGYVHLTPQGLSTGSTNPDGTEQNSVSLAFGQIDLSTTVNTPSGGSKLVRGSLNAEDMEKSLTTYWESGDAGNRQKFWMYKQFRRVVLTGVILLPEAKFGTGGNGYRTIFNITDTSLRPLTTRWVKCSSFGDVPHLGLLEFRPNGDVVAIGVPSQGRYSFEGESYAIENL